MHHLIYSQSTDISPATTLAVGPRCYFRWACRLGWGYAWRPHRSHRRRVPRPPHALCGPPCRRNYWYLARGIPRPLLSWGPGVNGIFLVATSCTNAVFDTAISLERIIRAGYCIVGCQRQVPRRASVPTPRRASARPCAGVRLGGWGQAHRCCGGGGEKEEAGLYSC